MKVTETSGYCICLLFLTLLKAIREEEEEVSLSFGGWIEQGSGFLSRHLFLKVTLYRERIGEFSSLYGSLWSKLFLGFTSVSLWTWQNGLIRNTLEGIWTFAARLFFVVLDCTASRLVKHQRTSKGELSLCRKYWVVLSTMEYPAVV